MRFSTGALVAALAPSVVCGFVTPSFSRGVTITSTSKSAIASTHAAGCACPSCTGATFGHPASCSCPSCAGGMFRHPAGCSCAACGGSKMHSGGCNCPSCAGSSTLLRMSDEDVTEAPSVPAEEEGVPADVVAMDGVLSDDEAHNVERPARGSGLHKHKSKEDRKAITDLEVGTPVEGRVKTITSYGAFLDIGCDTDALLHVSRMADEFVSNPEDIVKAGETVTVRIANVDLEKKQVAVTMRSEEAEARANAPGGGGGGRRKERPQRSSGDREAQRASLIALANSGHDDSKFIEGEVVSALNFGAFVRFDSSQLGEGLEGELDGLVHISALAEGRTDDVFSVVSVGDKVQIRVRDIDPEGNKVSLSMISKESEEKRGQRRGGGGGGRRPRGQVWTDAEMGAKDWKESLETFSSDQPEFTNQFLVIDRK